MGPKTYKSSTAISRLKILFINEFNGYSCEYIRCYILCKILKLSIVGGFDK